MAANTVNIALDFGRAEGADEDALFRLHILLARIYRTNGRYQSESNFFRRAHEQIDRAITLETAMQLPKNRVYVHLTRASIHYLENSLEEAKTGYQVANELSRQIGYVRGMILSSLGACEVALRLGDTHEGGEFAEGARLCLEESDLSADNGLRIRVLRQLIDHRMKVRDHATALRLGQDSLALSKQLNDPEQRVLSLKGIAVVSASQGNYKIGMQYFLRALELAEKLGFRPEVAQILINISTIYAHLFNYEDALQRYQRVLDEYRDVLDDRTQIVLYNNLGRIYAATEQHEAAAERFGRAFELGQNGDFPEMTALARAQLARTAIAQENLVRARRYAHTAAEYFADKRGVTGQQINVLNLGELAILEGNTVAARKYLHEGIELSRQLRDETNEQRGVQLLANLLYENGEYQRAYEYQLRHSQLQESFNRLQRNRKFMDLEIRYAIREQKQQIEQLTRENEYQAQLIQQGDQIGRQNDELRRVNEDLRRFAYVASHDLKEPLRMIGSYTQLVERLLGQHLEGDSREFFDYINEGVLRMNNLLDALLKYATVGNKEIEREPVDLNEVVEICMFHLKVRIEETNAQVSAEPLPTVLGEQPLLIQLFQNLIGNALKFVPADRTPQVRIRAEETDDHHTLHVSDNGIGIAEEYRERIFVIFQRLHARSEYDGTGIGLSICQRIVQKHGGDIWLDSEPGRGTTFSFNIPKT